MRWQIFPGTTRTQFVQRLVERSQPRVIAYALRGNTLWMVQAFRCGPQIACCVLSAFPRERGYGYRAAADADGAFRFDCPTALLELVPSARDAWRRQVENHHVLEAARPSAQPAVGEVWSLTVGPIREVEIVAVGRRIVGRYGTMRVTVAKRQLGRRVAEAPVVTR